MEFHNNYNNLDINIKRNIKEKYNFLKLCAYNIRILKNYKIKNENLFNNTLKFEYKDIEQKLKNKINDLKINIFTNLKLNQFQKYFNINFQNYNIIYEKFKIVNEHRYKIEHFKLFHYDYDKKEYKKNIFFHNQFGFYYEFFTSFNINDKIEYLNKQLKNFIREDTMNYSYEYTDELKELDKKYINEIAQMTKENLFNKFQNLFFDFNMNNRILLLCSNLLIGLLNDLIIISFLIHNIFFNKEITLYYDYNNILKLMVKTMNKIKPNKYGYLTPNKSYYDITDEILNF